MSRDELAGSAVAGDANARAAQAGANTRFDLEQLLCARNLAEAAGTCGPNPSAQAGTLERQMEILRCEADRRTHQLQWSLDSCRRARYRVPPWGGFVCGEKGNEWQAIEALLRHHGREEDLCILRTRPAWAPADWRPARAPEPARHGRDPRGHVREADRGHRPSPSRRPRRATSSSSPRRRDKIAWGIRLVRARQGGRCGPRPRGGPQPAHALRHPDGAGELPGVPARCAAEHPGSPPREAFSEARFQLENNYWSQPPEQLGGVRSTLYNFLVPFAEPEIAEVFCSDSTFDLRDIQLGKVVCMAIPQKYALQRRYASTLVKALAYQIILERFDRRAGPARTGSTATSSSSSRTSGSATPSARTARSTSCARPAAPSTPPPSPRIPSG